MKKTSVLSVWSIVVNGLLVLLYALAANAAWCISIHPALVTAVYVVTVVAVNVWIGTAPAFVPSWRMRICWHGVWSLIGFGVSLSVSIPAQIGIGYYLMPLNIGAYLRQLLACIVLLLLLFWNGILSVYLTSIQLGIRLRVIGILCGWIPGVNLFVLFLIVRTCWNEVIFECKKERLNQEREADKICQTKYPILFVHGVFFRDFKRVNYWGRIPKELIRNGAVVFYGEHSSAASIERSADELATRIRDVLQQTGCEKLNIIAHSKGGLDCRMAMADGIADCVASLTTINTPHRGSTFADYMLGKVPTDIQRRIEKHYNKAAAWFGDGDPDFMAAVRDLTAAHCVPLDKALPCPHGVFCQSVGSVLKKAISGNFPLNMSYVFVRSMSGKNDGLVGEDSFSYGEQYTLLQPPRNRGISHGDVSDLNRENIPGFEVREFYVQLVADLKNRGL